MRKKCCKSDIFTEHAPLIHKARDIQFQIAYSNGILPASITDINEKNVQAALESYWSKEGLKVVNERPDGAKNRVNLVFGTEFEFVPGSLEVYLSGDKMNGDQTDPDRDFTESPTYDGFTLILDPGKAHKLNVAPRQDEALTVNYRKRITFNTKGGT